MSEQHQDPQTYLETEAKIIAENETHAVVAVRVEKALFARNAPLLASLAGIILLGEPDPVSRVPR
ncbi:hypothetical protein H8A97_13160 [Bradyrhizobium sp. Arg62]|uniref:hypothetical protein n=1 Tax=Bradyrhizobium brasilense TaxID=1419277 RepID=UPI001E32EF4E|nr:hypothetical protein [Bradyrhizobium brasilense]MCC8946023.1 hypothetical protein [Bradyrhizobium brasilense]